MIKLTNIEMKKLNDENCIVVFEEQGIEIEAYMYANMYEVGKNEKFTPAFRKDENPCIIAWNKEKVYFLYLNKNHGKVIVKSMDFIIRNVSVTKKAQKVLSFGEIKFLLRTPDASYYLFANIGDRAFLRQRENVEKFMNRF